MTRNIVLAVVTLAVLGGLFLAYTLLTGQPGGGSDERRAVQELPPQGSAATQPLRIGDALQVPAGGKIMFRRYDDRTGRPRDMFMCQDWKPVPGTKNELRVTGPELAMMLPSGMIARVSADEGQIIVDRVEQSQMRPKMGWLAGNARIVVDRETRPDRAPAAERPADLITVSVDRLEFDLELGELKTDDRITIQSDDFELAGTGMHLIWNQAANRLETLTLKQGEQLVLYAAAGLFGMQDEDKSHSTTEPTSASAPATAPAKARRPKRNLRTPNAYDCTLTGGLVAEQYKGDERIGGLYADDVHLLFDAGGAERVMRGEPTSSAPASRPAREERQRLVLRWTGPLNLVPAPPGPVDEPNRRRFEAVGRPVVMTRGDATVRCGKVAYHDDTRRVWLYPTEGGTVEFGMGQNMSATAESVFIDRKARVVKLIGDVELRSQRGGGGREMQLSSIRCSYWGELHLAETPGGARDEQSEKLVDVGRLESGTFVGDVQVNLGQQNLTALRLDVGFRPAAGGESAEDLLDTAKASGDVRLSSGDGQLDAAELALAFARRPDGALYPRQMDAAGAVRITRKQTSLHGDRVSSALAPPPDPNAPGRPLFVMRSLDVEGGGELIDPDNHVAARGEQILAEFDGINHLTTARVTGTSAQPGLVHARPYTVRGERIDLDSGGQSLHADGPSRLAFSTQRSLQGERRARATPIIVNSARLLHVDGRRNTVRFEGNVVARSEDEELRSDNLTLLLEDAQPETRPARESEPGWPGLSQELGGVLAGMAGVPTDSSWPGVWQKLRGLTGGERRPSADDLFALRVEGQSERLRKEPVRLLADNALVSSETYEAGDPTPLVHADISAPRLEVDIVNRQIVSTGGTDLLMTDRRGVQQDDTARDALGLPSALVSRGPNQTAIRCEGRMTYSLGPDGPARRDTAVFEDRVVFVHRTGKEMVNLADMLPQLAAKPELLEKYKSRDASLTCDRLECWFAANASEKRPERGGGLTRAPLRLASLIASGSVYLRDQEESHIREVNAAWLEFNREQSLVHVRGSERAEARIYLQDVKTGEFSAPYTGRQLVVNLKDGTILAEGVSGELRRR